MIQTQIGGLESGFFPLPSMREGFANLVSLMSEIRFPQKKKLSNQNMI